MFQGQLLSCQMHHMQWLKVIISNSWGVCGHCKIPSGARAEPWWGLGDEAAISSEDPAV